MRALPLAIFLACAQGTAVAQDWTVTLSGGAWRADGDNAPLVSSGSISLERQLGDHWVGGSLGASQGDTSVPEIDAELDEDSFFGSLWWGRNAGPVDLTLGADYTDQQLDGGLTLGGVDVSVDGETRTLGVFASVARTIGEERAFTPSLTLSYSKTETELTLAAAGSDVIVSQTASGLALNAALNGVASVGDRVSVFGGVAFIAVDDAAALNSVNTRGEARQRLESGAAQWGETNAGVELAIGAAAFVSGSIGTTIGRDQEERFANASFGWRF